MSDDSRHVLKTPLLLSIGVLVGIAVQTRDPYFAATAGILVLVAFSTLAGIVAGVRRVVRS